MGRQRRKADIRSCPAESGSRLYPVCDPEHPDRHFTHGRDVPALKWALIQNEGVVMVANVGTQYDGSLLALDRLIDRDRRDVQNDIRLRCSSHYLGNGRALCRALGRYSMFVHTDDVGFGTHLLMDGAWEMWLTEFMVRTVKPGWTALDIGANYGYYSLMLADLVGHSGKCVAFEPNPLVAPLLEMSILVNGFEPWTDVRKSAISGTTGTSHFYLPKNEPKNARLVNDVDQSAIEAGLGTFTVVDVAPLDEAYRKPINFIKIDAEGAEGAIIGGMWNVMRAHKPTMVIEYNCSRMNDPRSPLEALLEVYRDLKYLDMDGRVYDVSVETVLSERVGQDWLLILESYGN